MTKNAYKDLKSESGQIQIEAAPANTFEGKTVDLQENLLQGWNIPLR
jgi:hypothetical protein